MIDFIILIKHNCHIIGLNLLVVNILLKINFKKYYCNNMIVYVYIIISDTMHWFMSFILFFY